MRGFLFCTYKHKSKDFECIIIKTGLIYCSIQLKPDTYWLVHLCKTNVFHDLDQRPSVFRCPTPFWSGMLDFEQYIETCFLIYQNCRIHVK